MKGFIKTLLTGLVLIIILSGCSTSEKSGNSDTLTSIVDSSSIGLFSKLQVHWEPGSIYERDYMELINPLAVNFNDTARVVDTLAFKAFLGSSSQLVKIDSSALPYQMQRYILKFKSSEICFFHYYYENSDPLLFYTQVHSALIRDQEIILKNDVHVGMTKRETLAKYPFVKEAADVVYINEGNGAYLRLEFKNQLLSQIEFWANSHLSKGFGPLDIFDFNVGQNTISTAIDGHYFDRILGNDIQVDIDTVEQEGETEDRSKVKYSYYYYTVTHKNAQFNLIDFSGKGTHLSLISGNTSTPLIILENGLKVGMTREQFNKFFDIPVDVQIAWINTRGGYYRITFKNDVITSIEFGKGKVGERA